MQLDAVPENHHATLIGALAPALRCAGVNWSTPRLEGYLGHAFAFSMNPDGNAVWQCGNFEWSYVFAMLDFFGRGVERIDASLKGAGQVSAERFDELKRQAWDSVRSSIDEGIPAVGWQFLTVADRDAGRKAFLWALIVGYDPAREEYIVHHRNTGEHRVRWDAVGHADPIQWLSLIRLHRLDGSWKEAAGHAQALRNAVLIMEGERPGVDAAAHGLKAWELWLDAFRSGNVNLAEAGNHARFLIGARGAAGEFLQRCVNVLPATCHTPLKNAAGQFREQLEALRQLEQACSADAADLRAAARLVETAFDREKSALMELRLAAASVPSG